MLSVVNRVLIVEDERSVAEELRERLLRLQVRKVRIEADAAGALDDARRVRPDIVLMNSEVRGRMDGIEAAEAFQRVLDIPVVLMTERADAHSIGRAKACSARGFLPRPFREGDLAMVVQIALQRHSLERQRDQRELRYSAALASVDDGVIAADAEGRVTFMNAVAEALTGWRSHDALGQPVELIFRLIDDTPNANPVTIGALFPDRSTSLLLVSRNGDVIPIDGSVTTRSEDADQGFGVVVAFRDLRHHRLAQHAARRAADQLRNGQRMQAIGQLTGGIAHDFNNLLTVINGYADELLSRGGWDPYSQRMLERIRQAGARSAALTSRLLSFSRVRDAGPVTSDPNALIGGISEMLQRMIGEDITFITRLKHHGGLVPVEPTQFEQVVMNLVLNARDAMPEGGRLVIETSRVSFSEPPAGVERLGVGDFVQVTVSDTGVGMPPSVQKQIFEPFFTTKPHGKGTGLGLATVYGIVHEAGGHVIVYSQLGSGTVFKVFLPLVPELAASRAPAPMVAGPQTTRTETVLLVEDDPDVREFVSVTIGREGFTVVTAASGAEALEVADTTEHVDVLVTDVVMPSISGIELSERLRTRLPGLHVVFLSGYPEDLRMNPNDAFLQKPFSGQQLLETLRTVVSKAR